MFNRVLCNTYIYGLPLNQINIPSRQACFDRSLSQSLKSFFIFAKLPRKKKKHQNKKNLRQTFLCLPYNISWQMSCQKITLTKAMPLRTTTFDFLSRVRSAFLHAHMISVVLLTRSLPVGFARSHLIINYPDIITIIT